MIVDVHYKTLDFQALLGHEMRHSHAMRFSLLGMMFVQKRVNCMLLGESCYTQMMSTNDFAKMKMNRDETGYSLNSSCW